MRLTTLSFLLPWDTPLFHFNCHETHHSFISTVKRHTTLSFQLPWDTTPSFQLPQDTPLFHFNCHETHNSFISTAMQMRHITLSFQLPCRWDTPLFLFQLPCTDADETHHSQLPLLSNSSDSFPFSHLLLVRLINTWVREKNVSGKSFFSHLGAATFWDYAGVWSVLHFILLQHVTC